MAKPINNPAYKRTGVSKQQVHAADSVHNLVNCQVEWAEGYE